VQRLDASCRDKGLPPSVSYASVGARGVLVVVNLEILGANIAGSPAMFATDYAETVPMAGSVKLSLPVSKWPAIWRRKVGSESAVKVKSYQPKNLCRSLT
jgi:hypothetical protein